MITKYFVCIFFTVLPLGATAHAAILNATSTNIVAVFASAQAGDTIKLEGSFGSLALQNRSFATRVTIDATLATVTDTLTIKNVDNLMLTGGKFGSANTAMRSGRAIAVYNGSNITIMKAIVANNGNDMGITFAGTIKPTVTAVAFSNQRLGLGVTSVSDAKISSNTFTRMTSDGINVVDSQRVLVTANKCSGSVPTLGAHPDCIQMWSIAGNPLQADLTITNNNISGATQGIASFDPSTASGMRLTVTGNTIYTSYPQGIACYGCFDSVFMNNALSTMPGSKWQTTMNIVGGSGNTIANNTIASNTVASLSAIASYLAADDSDPIVADEPNWLDVSQFSEAIPDLLLADLAELGAAAGTNGSGALSSGARMGGARMGGLDGIMGLASNAGAVPEPGVWLQLLTGFGLAGLMLRRRRAAMA